MFKEHIGNRDQQKDTSERISHLQKNPIQGSYSKCESNFPDYSLAFPWVVNNSHFLSDYHFTYLQKEVREWSLNR